MRHPIDGEAWNPYFALEPRNVRLGLAIDGFNSFGNTVVPYNMCTVVLTT